MAERKTVHGHWSGGKSSPEYSAWCLARTRCHNPNNRAFPHYGGRGLTMCDRWRFGQNGKSGFECFLEDMGLRPTPQHTLERRDNDKGYGPGNCEWATRKDQQRNRRGTLRININGEEVSLAEAAERHGIPWATLRYRIRSGWPVERALTAPIARRDTS